MLYKYDPTILFLFFLGAILTVWLDFSLTTFIDIDFERIYHSSTKEVHTAVIDAIGLGSIITVSLIFLLYFTLNGNNKYALFLSSILLVGACIYYILFSTTDIYLVLTEILLLVVNVFLLRVLWSQKKFFYLALFLLINAVYLWWHHEPESLFFIEANNFISLVISIVLHTILQNCGKQLDEILCISKYFEIDQKPMPKSNKVSSN